MIAIMGDLAMGLHHIFHQTGKACSFRGHQLNNQRSKGKSTNISEIRIV